MSPAEKDTLAALEAVYEATCALGISPDLESLVGEVLDRAQALIGAEHCGLMLLDSERGELRMRRLRGFGARARENESLALRLDQGLAGFAATHRRAVRVGDVTRDPRYVPGLPEARSNLVVPLILRNQVVGVLSVESSQPDAFSEAHEKLLTVLGAHAALAIEASRSQERLGQRLTQLNALYRISQLASEPRDPGSLLVPILEIAQEAIPQGYVAILLLDPATGTLAVRAQRGYAEGADAVRIPLGVGVTGRCAQQAQVIVVDDVTAHPDYLPGVPGARSEIALPLLVEGRVIGVLNAEAEAPRAYGEDHVRTLSVIAQQVAVVLRAAQLHEEQRRLAITDPLTGLYNRRQFVGELEEAVRRARRYKEGLAVVFVDLDDFKTLNDRFGHAAGDRALQALAAAMRSWVRDTDEVARLGGDEFAALLLHTDRESAGQVVERLRRAVEAAAVPGPGGQPMSLRLSSGVALFPEHGTDPESLLMSADAALYQAKRAGKNRVAMAGPEGPAHPPPRG